MAASRPPLAFLVSAFSLRLFAVAVAASVTLNAMRKVPAGRLLSRLLVATLFPTILALGVFGTLAYEVASHVLEDELGRRLSLAATGAAGLILPEQLGALEDGDTSSLNHANVLRKLTVAKQRFDVRRVVLLSRGLVARGDTERRIPDGAEAYEFRSDRLEIERATSGPATPSPLFQGHDGITYKRAYAAIRADEGSSQNTLGFAVVEASADYFQSLHTFGQRLLLGGTAALIAVILITSVLALRISRPVVQLAAAAERIGRGDLENPVAATSTDEVGFLARTLDDMRAALKARDERLQMMLAGIAHEVRNPLGGLELYAGLLRDALADQPDRLEEVRRIEREVSYLNRVVTEFLDYARRPPVALGQVRVIDLLTEVAELSSTPDLRVKVDADDSLRVVADETQLRRVLLNLARNAVTACEKANPLNRRESASDAPVILRARRDLGTEGDPLSVLGIRFQIDDHGPGVEPALREQIFTPFFTTREKGTGLGLAFVREIVRAHGSEIHVVTSPSGGARFEFVLSQAVASDNPLAVPSP